MNSDRDFAEPSNSQRDKAMNQFEIPESSRGVNEDAWAGSSMDVSAGTLPGFSSDNLGSMSVSYPQFFEKRGEKFKKYEHFSLYKDNLLSFDTF